MQFYNTLIELNTHARLLCASRYRDVFANQASYLRDLLRAVARPDGIR